MTCCDKQIIFEEHVNVSFLWDWRMGLALVIAGQAMMFGLGISLTPLNFGSLERLWIHLGLAFSTCLVGALLGKPLIVSAWDHLRKGQLTLEILFILNIIGAFAGSLMSTVTGTGSVYYEVIAVVLVIYTFGKRIGSYSKTEALKTLEVFVTEWNQVQVCTCCGTKKIIPIAALKPDHVVLIGPGERIAVDGIILKGEGFVQQTDITGDAFPIAKKPGDTLRAGMYAVDGIFKMQPILSGALPYSQQIAQAALASIHKPSLFQAQVDRMMRAFIPLVVIISILTFITWLYIHTLEVALFHTMSVLLVACPCALGLATPLAIWRATSAFAALGLIVKNPDTIQRLSQIDTIIFDKTGTLSLPHLQLKEWHVHKSFSQIGDALLACISELEASINHPIAQALKHADLLKKDASSYPITYKSLRFIPGKGIEAEVLLNENYYQLKIGDQSLMPTDSLEAFQKLQTQASIQKEFRLVYVSLNNQPAAIAVLNEAFRGNLKTVFEHCQSEGLRLEILTGDTQYPANYLYSAPIKSGLTAKQKEAHLLHLIYNSKARLLYIGDGLNDLNAMSAALVSIALQTGVDLNKMAADGIWIGKDYENLLSVIQLSKKVMRSIRHNLYFSGFYNIIGISLAALGYLNPIIAALLMLFSSALVCYRTVISCSKLIDK
jgi:heavy metal translocating P-type ATPase